MPPRDILLLEKLEVAIFKAGHVEDAVQEAFKANVSVAPAMSALSPPAVQQQNSSSSGGLLSSLLAKVGLLLLLICTV